MGENRENHASSGLSELEKTFQEYKSRLEHAEQESQQIVDLAWKKAETIINGQQSEAQKIAEEMKRAARAEADRIMLEAKNRAADIEKEVENRVKKEAKDKIKREMEKLLSEAKTEAEKDAQEIKNRANKEAEEVIKDAKTSNQLKLAEETNEIIANAEQKARKIREDSVIRMNETHRLIDEVSQKAEGILNSFKVRLQSELGDLTLKLDQAQDRLDMKSILVKNDISVSSIKTGGGSFRDRKELVILPPYTGSQIKKLAEMLKQIPGIKIDGSAATEDNFSIFINITEPIPLHNLLAELSLVESSDIKGEIVKLRLKPSKIGSSEY
jgi:vacuolar-type H+-ATPase subunit H